MRKFMVLLLVVVLAAAVIGCGPESADRADSRAVNEQQQHYQNVHPVPFYDYSIPRDVLIQIYDVVTTKAYTTYTIIESITGETKFHGPSVGYGIPVDTQLTNPIQPYRYGSVTSDGVSVEQPEPNGLFSSKNTDGTWVLFIQSDGKVVPVYTEHKVTTFPFEVIKTEDGWARAEGSQTEFVINISR